MSRLGARRTDTTQHDVLAAEKPWTLPVRQRAGASLPPLLAPARRFVTSVVPTGRR